MSAKKIRDLVVKVGEYTDRNTGNKKGKFRGIGALMFNDQENSYFIMLDRTFNPAGVPNSEQRESILVSCYPPKDRHEEQGQNRDHGNQQNQYATQSSGYRDDSDIPF